MASSAQVKLLQNFQEYLSVEKGLSDNSIFSYGYDLNKFKSYLDKQQIDLLNVQSKDIMKFLVEEKSRKISAKTLAREVVAIRQFYKYLRDEKQVDFNPTDKIETP
ncbi:MAG TPA: site-specific integrase, partial [Leptospiraceae bacterium]|nr:site-specific integrase [Leptospiraceae bacterium]